MRSWNWLGVALCGAATLGVAAACSSSNDSTGTIPNSSTGADASVVVVNGPGCAAGTKECVNDKLARICPADGSAWIAQTCAADEKCTAGACAKDPSVVAQCTSAQDTCVGNTAMHCKADGNGFDAAACPANTACVGAGKCLGACFVGASSCNGPTTVATCTDGLQVTETACPSGQFCVDQGNGTAACKAGDCDPTACTVCGNKVDAAADQTKFTSSCQATPGGYKWVASQCAGVQTCNPSAGGSCSSGGPGAKNAQCASECTPGQNRCASNNLGIQTCDATGHWAATVTSCNANPAATDLVCMTDPTNGANKICGDALCASGAQGACQPDGKIKLCGANGKLAATATSCSAGSCQQSGGTYNGAVAGQCQAQCQNGAERCVLDGGTTYQTCTNGIWGAPTNCATGTCYSYTSATTGLSAKLCNAVCSPGTHRCSNTDGDAGAGNDHKAIETCSAAGQWSAAAACTIGVCQSSGNDAACVAECVPGAKVCLNGNTEDGACTAAGLYPSSGTACGTGKTCRTTNANVVVGCVECLGATHGGTPDSRCVDSANSNAVVTTGGTGTEICQNDDTWPANGTDCPASTTCSTQSTQDVCFQTMCPSYCCFGPPGPGQVCGPFCSTPGSSTCGTTTDCCSGPGGGSCSTQVATYAAACK
jgi:hypothetical protein